MFVCVQMILYMQAGAFVHMHEKQKEFSGQRQSAAHPCDMCSMFCEVWTAE